MLSALLSQILKALPTTPRSSATVLSYLFSRLNEFRTQQWDLLQKTPFIPIFSTDDLPPSTRKGDEKGQPEDKKLTLLRYATVSDVLIQPKPSSWQAQLYSNIFDYADFGGNGNLFLKNCGVKDDPTPEHFAVAITRNYQRYLSKNGVAKYLELLSVFAGVYARLPSNYVKALAATPFCLAYLFEEKEDDKKQLMKEDESFMVRRRHSLKAKLITVKYVVKSKGHCRHKESKRVLLDRQRKISASL